MRMRSNVLTVMKKELRRFFGEGVTIETGFVEREHPRFEFF